MVICLVGFLSSGDLDLFGIDHNDIVPRVDMGCETGFMLASKAVGYFSAKPAQRIVCSIHYEPLSGNRFFFCTDRLHLGP